MNTKTLLVAIDFSKATAAVLDEAATLAKALAAKLWVLHVASGEAQAMAADATQFTGYAPEIAGLPGDVQLARDLHAGELKREHAELQGMAAKLREEGLDAQAILLQGDAAPLIVEKAGELEAGLVVLGSHGHGLLHKALLGSVSEAVIRRARCPVVVVPKAGE